MVKDMGNVTVNGKIGLVVMSSCEKLGKKVDEYLQRKMEVYDESDPMKNSFILPIEEIRFSTGDGKVVLDESCRGRDLYILCDVGNYSCTYKMHGFITHKGPDEHFQDIKRVLSAVGGRANKVTVVMPLLYSSRQHRKKLRESLDLSLIHIFCSFLVVKLQLY